MASEGICRRSHRGDASRSERGHDEECDQPSLHHGVLLPRPERVKRNEYPGLLPGTHEEETVVKDKSVGASLVLTFLFGPLGIFYVTVLGALVMLVLAVIVAVLTFGLGLVIIWPISMIWAAIVASNKHSRYQAWLADRPRGPLPPPPVP